MIATCLYNIYVRLAIPFCIVVVCVYTPPATILHPGPRRFYRHHGSSKTLHDHYITTGIRPPFTHLSIARKTSLTGILPHHHHHQDCPDSGFRPFMPKHTRCHADSS